MHHVVDRSVLLLHAAQAGAAGPSLRQCAAVGVALLRLAAGAARPVGLQRLRDGAPLLTATARSNSLGMTETRVKVKGHGFWKPF